jgi:hypothetical protein
MKARSGAGEGRGGDVAVTIVGRVREDDETMGEGGGGRGGEGDTTEGWDEESDSSSAIARRGDIGGRVPNWEIGDEGVGECMPEEKVGPLLDRVTDDSVEGDGGGCSSDGSWSSPTKLSDTTPPEVSMWRSDP